MHFIQSHQADEYQIINLHHVVTFKKAYVPSSPLSAELTTMIVFETSNGELIWWKYYKNKTGRDLDYEQLMVITGLSEKEDNNG